MIIISNLDIFINLCIIFFPYFQKRINCINNCDYIFVKNEHSSHVLIHYLILFYYTIFPEANIFSLFWIHNFLLSKCMILCKIDSWIQIIVCAFVSVFKKSYSMNIKFSSFAFLNISCISVWQPYIFCCLICSIQCLLFMLCTSCEILNVDVIFTIVIILLLFLDTV